MKPIITLKNIYKKYTEENGKKVLALQDINLEIFEGEIFAIVGPSGAGKSTLLRIICGLDKEYLGEVEYSPSVIKKDISFVFQKFALFPWLDIFQNAEIGLIAQNIPKFKRKQIVEAQLKTLGLERFAKAKVRELSGGMQQRVGLARALATSPKLIFMDEPFSELDIFTAKELRNEILQIWQERKPTIVMVTHNIKDALEMADRVIILTSLPGKIEKLVVNKLTRPRQVRSEEFYKLEDEIEQLITS